MSIATTTQGLAQMPLELGRLANLYVSASGSDKETAQTAIMDKLDELMGLDLEIPQHRKIWLGSLAALLERSSLSYPLFIRPLRLLTEHEYYEGCLREFVSTYPPAAEQAAAYAAEYCRFRDLGLLLENAEGDMAARIGAHTASALKELLRVCREGSLEDMEWKGDMVSHMRDIGIALRTLGVLGLSDEKLLDLIFELDRESAFGFCCEEFPDFGELGGLYIRSPPGEKRDVVEKLFIKSVAEFMERFVNIRGDGQRAALLPYDDERKKAVLSDAGLSEKMKKNAGQILGLMSGYSTYRVSENQLTRHLATPAAPVPEKKKFIL